MTNWNSLNFRIAPYSHLWGMTSAGGKQVVCLQLRVHRKHVIWSWCHGPLLSLSVVLIYCLCLSNTVTCPTINNIDKRYTIRCFILNPRYFKRTYFIIQNILNYIQYVIGLEYNFSRLNSKCSCRHESYQLLFLKKTLWKLLLPLGPCYML